MPATLTSLARAVDALTSTASLPAPGGVHGQRIRSVAEQVDQFAADHPNLDPETHLRLLTKLARALDRHTECEFDAVRRTLGLPQPWTGPWPDPFTAPGEDHDPVIVVCDDQAAALAARLPLADGVDPADVRRVLARALTDAFVAGAGINPNA